AGRRVAGYRIVRELGRGGMGVVYEAVHVDLDRPVALKVLGLHAAPDSNSRRRFLNEAKTAAGLHHTHIVPVFDVGQVGGLCYYAMQKIEGCGLDRVLKVLRRGRSTAAGSTTGRSWSRRSTPLPTVPFGEETVSWGTGIETAGTGRGKQMGLSPDEPPPFEPPTGSAYYRWVARIGKQAAEALAHAHRRGVIHRDIKPSNLLVDARGSVWVADFGLARRLADPGLTRAEGLVGTPRYMSPEQARGGPIDGRTDVYSLGATLYELLTLRPPFEGQSAAELVAQIKDREPPPPRRTDPRLPRDLETIVLKAMAKRPADRYDGAAELAEDLGRFLAYEPVRARRIGPVGRLWRFARRHPALTAVTTVAAAVILAVATVAYIRVARERDRALMAERRAHEALRQQLLSEASLLLTSAMPNRRQSGLELIKRVAAMGPDAAMRTRLRSEAIEFLALRAVEAQPEVPTGRLWGFAFGPEGHRLATVSEDGMTLQLWDVASRKVVLTRQLPSHRSEATPADAPRVRGGGRSGSGVTAVGHIAAAVWSDGQGVRLLDIDTGAHLGDLEMLDRRILAVFAAPSGDRLATIDIGRGRDPDLMVHLWDTSHGDGPIAALIDPRAEDHGWSFPMVAFSPDGRTIATGRGWEPDIALWDAEDGQFRGTIRTTEAITALALGPDGLLAAAGGGTIKLWDVASHSPLPGLSQHQGFVRLMRFSPDGLLAVTGVGTGVEIWDPPANAMVAALPTPERVHDLAFAPGPGPGGLRLAAALSSKVLVWAVVDPAIRARFTGFDGAPASLAFRPDGLLAMASLDAGGTRGNPLRLWCSDRCTSTAFSRDDVRPTALAFDDRGHLAAVDTTTLLWFDPLQREAPADLIPLPRPTAGRRGGPPRPSRVQAIARSQDGRMLVLARGDELLIWRAEKPDRLQRIMP
ncbi:MAG: protein kinase, partial [Isosphaeraceae bacterium]|nr:protein kinase [Isosphaeraceae bacterium]